MLCECWILNKNKINFNTCIQNSCCIPLLVERITGTLSRNHWIKICVESHHIRTQLQPPFSLSCLVGTTFLLFAWRCTSLFLWSLKSCATCKAWTAVLRFLWFRVRSLSSLSLWFALSALSCFNVRAFVLCHIVYV